MAVTWKKLAYEDDVITKALLTTKGDIIYASAASTPARLGIGTDDYVLQVATDLPAWADPTTLPVAAHTLDNHSNPVAAVAFDGQQATNFVLESSASPPATAVLGKIYFDTDLSAYICTAIV